MATSNSLWCSQRVLVLSPTPTYPLDFGNRRRVHTICDRLKRLGAHITFLHYLSESDWRFRLPPQAQQTMSKQWDEYISIIPSRPLHCEPAQSHHQIDEWWDPEIGRVIEWLFEGQHFDIVIVNYTWLSKAFEFVPTGVVRVLDTHDKFSGRRELLELNGIAPEFFFTNESEELKALRRADIVWAIKKQEQEFFESIHTGRVLTVLHAESSTTTFSRPRQEIVRFGIFGARNRINEVNIRAFLDVCYQFLLRTLLPCEIVLAGSCCDLLEDITYPFLTKLGRVEHVDEFYDAVDVVLGPMAFSTGLKIKMGEALSAGKAVIAHEHCFEGYVPTHEFHTLSSFEAMLQACREVVRLPRLIDELEIASVRSLHAANRLISTAIEETLIIPLDLSRSVVMVLDLSDLSVGSITIDHVIDAAKYLKHQCDVIFYIDGEAGQPNPGVVERLQKMGKIAISPIVGNHFKNHNYNKLFSRKITIERTLGEIAQLNPVGLWLTRLQANNLPSIGYKGWVVVPLGVLAYRYRRREVGAFVDSLKKRASDILFIDGERSALLAQASDENVKTLLVPNFWKADEIRLIDRLRAGKRDTLVFISGSSAFRYIELFVDIARTTWGGPIKILFDDKDLSDQEVSDLDRDRQGISFCALSEYYECLRGDSGRPFCAVQIGEFSGSGLFKECFVRSGIPFMHIGANGRGTMKMMPVEWRQTEISSSAQLLFDVLHSNDKLDSIKQLQSSAFSYANDAGWTIIWDELGSKLNQQKLQNSVESATMTIEP